MTILDVPSIDYPNITAAMAAAVPGDTINVAAGYGPEVVTVTVSDVTITGPVTATGIELTLDAGVTGLVLGAWCLVAMLRSTLRTRVPLTQSLAMTVIT
jgi:hypothetical protein